MNDDDFYLTGTLTPVIRYSYNDFKNGFNQKANIFFLESGNYLINFSINPEFDPTPGAIWFKIRFN